MSDAERQARLGRRHLLAHGHAAASPLAVAESLVALHSTLPVTVYLSVAARMREPTLAAVDRALYEERSLVRTTGMRGTLFVVPAALAPVVVAACAEGRARGWRRQVERLLAGTGVTAEPEGWVRRVEVATLAALEARGEATMPELAADVPELGRRLRLGPGSPAGGDMALGTFVLSILAGDGRVLRARPRGGWSSTQYRWVLAERWLAGGLPHLDPEAAETELARLYLAAFGPATEADLRWWAGWTARQARRALEAAGAVAVEVAEGTAFVLAGDLEEVAPAEPAAALLPALDPTVMGWTQRAWYLGPHGRALFDRAGNAGPTTWWAGRVVGGWWQRPDGEVVVRVLEDAGAAAAAAIGEAAARLQALVGTARVTVPFRTPLDLELASPS